MNVRHKIVTHKVHPDVDEVGEFYIHRHGTGGVHIAFAKSDYEPVPTETWRDVTGECVYEANMLLDGMGEVADVSSDRRFRKVQMFETPRGGWKSAFIIERKEP